MKGGRWQVRFDESVRNLRDVAPTVYLNVPKGYEELVRAFRRDRALAATFFARVQVLFYAAAGLSQHVADELQQIAVETCGERLVLVTGLGSTETAPMAICRPWASDAVVSRSASRCPASMAKLVAVWATKLELRVRGPNVTPGYWRQDALTRAAFDDEGFYCMGDAVRLVDIARPFEGVSSSTDASKRTSSSRPARGSASARCARASSRISRHTFAMR